MLNEKWEIFFIFFHHNSVAGKCICTNSSHFSDFKKCANMYMPLQNVVPANSYNQKNKAESKTLWSKFKKNIQIV